MKGRRIKGDVVLVDYVDGTRTAEYMKYTPGKNVLVIKTQHAIPSSVNHQLTFVRNHGGRIIIDVFRITSTGGQYHLCEHWAPDMPTWTTITSAPRYPDAHRWLYKQVVTTHGDPT